MPVIRVVGHQDVNASLLFSGENGMALTLTLHSPETVMQFRSLLERALNCNPEGPQWAFDLCDAHQKMLDAKKEGKTP